MQQRLVLGERERERERGGGREREKEGKEKIHTCPKYSNNIDREEEEGERGQGHRKV